MSKYLALDRKATPEEMNTVEGRLADIMKAEDCVVTVGDYELLDKDKKLVVKALWLMHLVRQLMTIPRAGTT